MKRLPLLFTLLALVVLSASSAYWILQLYKPEQRPLAAAPSGARPEPAIDAAAGLFGGQATAVVAANYQLTGVVAAGRDSVAILVADGGVPKALKLGKEVAAGVTVQEVHPRYVMLSEGGVLKRIELAADAKAGAGMSGAPPDQQPNQQPNQPSQQSSQMTPGQRAAIPSPVTQAPAQPPQNLPQNVQQPVPQGQPNVQGQVSPGPLAPPPPPPVQMPPPTRGLGGQNPTQ